MTEVEKTPLGVDGGAMPLPSHLNKPRLRREQASEYLDVVFGIEVRPATLAKWASTGGGPEFQKINRRPLYPRESLDAWAVKKLGPLVSNTSQEG